MINVSPESAVAAWLDGSGLFVDVRTPGQHAVDGIDGSACLPLEAIQAGELPVEAASGKTILLVCNYGRMSELAALYLQEAGVTNAVSVLGGLPRLRELLAMAATPGRTPHR